MAPALSGRSKGVASTKNVTDTLGQKNGILQTLGRQQDDQMHGQLQNLTYRKQFSQSIFIARWGCSVLHVSCQIGKRTFVDARPSAASHRSTRGPFIGS